jgi:putative ABC transport system permease protein
MLKFRLKFAFRSLLRNKTYTLLNISGLALGLAVSLVIYLYLKSELTYDQHFDNYERVYRVQSLFSLNDRTERMAGAGFGLAPLLEKEYAYVESAARMMHINEQLRFTAEGVQHFIGDVGLADGAFLNTMGIPLLEGDVDTALSVQRSIVLTESLSNSFFGPGVNPIGKKVSTTNYTYTVTGLMADLPANTHHKFVALISSFYEEMDQSGLLYSLWDPGILTFVKFKTPQDAVKLEKDFEAFYDKYMASLGESLGGEYDIAITPLAEVHFEGGFLFDRITGNYAYLFAFAGIGLLILVLACINYINMATARSLKRFKEIGMRKIIGASKREIYALVLVESMLLSLLSLGLAFVMVELSLEFSQINTILEKDLSLSFSREPALYWFPLMLALVVGFLSGVYPAFILGKVPGLTAIKGARSNAGAGLLMRKVLVGFQFTISVAVVITALLMYRQIEFVKNKDLGFNKDSIILIPIQDTLTMAKVPQLQRELEKSPYVLASATANSIIGKGTGRALLSIEGKNGKVEKRIMDFMKVSADYFRTMEISFTRGRPFNHRDFEEHKNYVVINQSMAASMGGDNPIGQKLSWEYNERGEPIAEAEVIGVVSDFNAHSLHDPIEPLVIGMEHNVKGTLHVRVNCDVFSTAIGDIERIWGADNSNRPFQFTLLNEDLERQYKEEQKQSRLILFLTYLAIFISFMGLTGLASFSAALRTKEIGIRKVLGAEMGQMIQLMFNDMLMLIVVSVTVALPLAWVLTRVWLHNFAYQASLSPLVFVLSAAFSILVSYLIVSYHSYRIARSSVVRTLKYE